jgi:LmbE family N-acetylglucosaminyl deacetylase
MLTDHERIARQQSDPALLRLHRALGRLKSVLTYMNTGAHPDDEHNGLLAALRFAYGMRAVVACSTRGEGGQNAIGPERGAALGVLRTREMEASARVIDARVVWLGHGPDDPLHDFGFSKDGDDTLARWGKDRILERLVRAYRTERPDIVSPTFLDVPGQHGHHRAMTRAAIRAFGLAADPAAFPEHLAEGLRPWQVAKLYLPAWSGAGLSYDDEEPPPPETLVITPPRRDEATGATFAQIGEWSRACHCSQGMGVWNEVGRTSWQLHLLLDAQQAPGPEREIQEGLPYDLRALAALPGLPSRVGRPLEATQHAIDAAIGAFPDGAAIAAAALDAAGSLDAAREVCPPKWALQLEHRLARKARELDLVLFEAHGVVARASARPSRLAPGRKGSIEVFTEGNRVPIEVDLVSNGAIVASGRTSSSGVTILDIAAASDASPSNPYPPTFDPLGGNGEAAVRLTMDLGGRQATRLVDLEEPLLVLPDTSAHLDPDAVIVNLAQPLGEIRVGLRLEAQEGAESGALSFDPPEGWMVAPEVDGIRLTPPAGLKPSRTVLKPKLSGQPAYRITPIRSAPGGSAYFHRPIDLPILAVDARLPDGTRIGYVGGGNDRVDVWLARLGLEIVELDPERVTRGNLSGLTTIVVGIFAFGTRSDLRASTERLRSWVEKGGHLVTFYHRPSDGWDPETVPPRRLQIGLPSLRWRVTDPNAPVHVLAPDHPLIRGPNVIGPDDWAGWDKERGLYFASEWDEAYVPLLAIGDPGEDPLHGAFVSAAIGRGRHTHTSLVLHHQLEKLVPGAFRLLANLVQPA